MMSLPGCCCCGRGASDAAAVVAAVAGVGGTALQAAVLEHWLAAGEAAADCTIAPVAAHAADAAAG